MSQGPPPLMKGYLKKMSPNILSGWQERWFEISADKQTLTYWKTKPSDAESQSKDNSQNSLHIKAFQKIEVKNSQQFVIITKERDYQLLAPNAADKDRWVNALNLCIRDASQSNMNKTEDIKVSKKEQGVLTSVFNHKVKNQDRQVQEIRLSPEEKLAALEEMGLFPPVKQIFEANNLTRIDFDYIFLAKMFVQSTISPGARLRTVLLVSSKKAMRAKGSKSQILMFAPVSREGEQASIVTDVFYIFQEGEKSSGTSNYLIESALPCSQLDIFDGYFFGNGATPLSISIAEKKNGFAVPLLLRDITIGTKGENGTPPMKKESFDFIFDARADAELFAKFVAATIQGKCVGGWGRECSVTDEIDYFDEMGETANGELASSRYHEFLIQGIKKFAENTELFDDRNMLVPPTANFSRMSISMLETLVANNPASFPASAWTDHGARHIISPILSLLDSANRSRPVRADVVDFLMEKYVSRYLKGLGAMWRLRTKNGFALKDVTSLLAFLSQWRAVSLSLGIFDRDSAVAVSSISKYYMHQIFITLLPSVLASLRLHMFAVPQRVEPSPIQYHLSLLPIDLFRILNDSVNNIVNIRAEALLPHLPDLIRLLAQTYQNVMYQILMREQQNELANGRSSLLQLSSLTALLNSFPLFMENLRVLDEKLMSKLYESVSEHPSTSSLHFFDDLSARFTDLQNLTRQILIFRVLEDFDEVIRSSALSIKNMDTQKILMVTLYMPLSNLAKDLRPVIFEEIFAGIVDAISVKFVKKILAESDSSQNFLDQITQISHSIDEILKKFLRETHFSSRKDDDEHEVSDEAEDTHLHQQVRDLRQEESEGAERERVLLGRVLERDSISFLRALSGLLTSSQDVFFNELVHYRSEFGPSFSDAIVRSLIRFHDNFIDANDRAEFAARVLSEMASQQTEEEKEEQEVFERLRNARDETEFFIPRILRPISFGLTGFNLFSQIRCEHLLANKMANDIIEERRNKSQKMRDVIQSRLPATEIAVEKKLMPRASLWQGDIRNTLPLDAGNAPATTKKGGKKNVYFFDRKEGDEPSKELGDLGDLGDVDNLELVDAKDFFFEDIENKVDTQELEKALDSSLNGFPTSVNLTTGRRSRSFAYAVVSVSASDVRTNNIAVDSSENYISPVKRGERKSFVDMEIWSDGRGDALSTAPPPTSGVSEEMSPRISENDSHETLSSLPSQTNQWNVNLPSWESGVIIRKNKDASIICDSIDQLECFAAEYTLKAKKTPHNSALIAKWLSISKHGIKIYNSHQDGFPLFHSHLDSLIRVYANRGLSDEANNLYALTIEFNQLNRQIEHEDTAVQRKFLTEFHFYVDSLTSRSSWLQAIEHFRLESRILQRKREEPYYALFENVEATKKTPAYQRKYLSLPHVLLYRTKNNQGVFPYQYEPIEDTIKTTTNNILGSLMEHLSSQAALTSPKKNITISEFLASRPSVSPVTLSHLSQSQEEIQYGPIEEVTITCRACFTIVRRSTWNFFSRFLK